MGNVNSRVVINNSVIRNLTRASIEALERTAEVLHTEIASVSQVVPMDKGTLSGEAFFCDYSQSSKGRVSLVHSTPYARRLYYHPEFHFSKEEHANAKGKWFEDWTKGGKNGDFVEKTYAACYKEIAGT